MLATGKHGCMPSFMGLILLAGIVMPRPAMPDAAEERG